MIENHDYVGKWFMRSNKPSKNYYVISSIQLLKILHPIDKIRLAQSVHVIECMQYPYSCMYHGELGPGIEQLDLSKLRVAYEYKCPNYIREMVLPNPVSEDLSTLLELFCLGKLC